MHEDTTGIAPAGVRAWALRGLDETVGAALRLDDYAAARACADLALFAHVVIVTSLPASPEVDALLGTLEERVRQLAAHRDALDPATWSHRQEIEAYTRRLERRAPDGHLLAARLKRHYAALYALLARLSPDADLLDHAEAVTVEDLIIALKDALGVA